MAKILSYIGIYFLCIVSCTCMYGQTIAFNKEILQTGDSIRAAFAKGDVKLILSYHHPEVRKALAYNHYLVGSLALQKDLQQTLSAYSLEFVENKVESILMLGETAVEQSLFVVKGVPKAGGRPFIFKGRSQVVYIHYSSSPTGWASIQEMVQPATE